jgi:pimeloyl-ACP methyl ester carboxylesterase
MTTTLAGRGGGRRARLLRGVLHLGLHPARARGRHRGPDHRGGAGLPLPAVRRGLAGAGSTPASRDTADRLGGAPRRRGVISDGLDAILPPGFGRSVAGLIPGARFEVMAEESHQPFQEVPDDWNARVHAFSREARRRRPRRHVTPSAGCAGLPNSPASRPGRRTRYPLLASEAVSARVVILS